MSEYDNTRFLTVEEVASMLRKKERTIREWCYNQSIPHYKVGNSLLFERDEILEWVNGNCRVDVRKFVNRTREILDKSSLQSLPPKLHLKK